MTSKAQEYLADLEKEKPDWQKKALAMYAAGCSNREVMRELDLTPARWKALESDIVSSDFAEIVEYGLMLSAAWWEEQGRVNLRNKEFNTSLWLANVKARLGWGDSAASDTLDMRNADAEDLKRQIDVLMGKYANGQGKVNL